MIATDPPQPPQKHARALGLSGISGQRQPEPDAVAQRDAAGPGPAVDLLVEHRVGTRRRQQAHAVGLAAARHRGVDQGDGAGVAEPAGGGDLGAPPRDRVRRRGVERQRPDDPLGDRARLGVVGGERHARRHDVGDAAVVLGGRADVEVGAERAGDLGGDELADRLAGDAPDDLALEDSPG